MRNFLVAMGAGALLFGAAMPAMAQDTAKAESVQALHEATAALTKDLTEPQKLHFYAIYNNYNLIKTVEIVRGDVEMAVDSCGKENPDLKDKIAGRFAAWKDEVNPILAEAQGHTDNMVIVQDYVPPESIENIFTKVDAARADAQAQVTKVPVTSLEACNFLHDKMDETQANMIKLLRASLMSYPQSLGTEKAAEKAAEDKPAEGSASGSSDSAQPEIAPENPALEAVPEEAAPAPEAKPEAADPSSEEL